MSQEHCSEFIDRLNRAGSVEEIHETCSAITAHYGFSHFLYASTVPISFVAPPIYVISGYPSNWRDHYNARGYPGVDPTVRHCLQRVTPLPWDQLLKVERSEQQVWEFMGEAHSFGLKNGLSLPVHGSGGERAMFSLSGDQEISQEVVARIRHQTPELYLLAAHLHEAALRVVDVLTVHSDPASLTPREKECLLWAAEGKTSWETSRILGIAERTVIFHLQNASEKLQVLNRQHAVARAVAQGLIAPQLR